MRNPFLRDKVAAATLRPESELLLACAGVCVGSCPPERPRTLLAEGIDWELLVQAGLRHRILPLLYRGLETTCPEAVPRATLDRLRQRVHATALRNLFLTGQLLKLLRLFARHDIRAIPFKGPALAAAAYGDVSLREFNDLDIFLREDDIPRAKQLLRAERYEEQPQFEAEYECAFLSADGGYHVDLHWGFIPPYIAFPLGPLRLWEQAGSVVLAGTPVAAFRPEALLLILCLHGAKHCWQRLKWICDIAGLIRLHPAMDWDQILAWAARMGRTRVLSLGLLLAGDLLGTSLPDPVLRRAKPDPAVKYLAAEVRKWLFPEVGGGDHSGNPTGLQCELFLLTASERLRDRVRHAAHLARIPSYRRAWQRIPLTASLSVVYSLLRPVWRVGKAGLRLLRPRSSTHVGGAGG
ncbi:MAG TPA: nucleotidyltransferase family protein [Gemmataceae bacterium]|nr:nucleotidyltransferase family protein [Gemmataceae bacterium]